MSFDQGCRSVLFISFVMKQKWIYKKKKKKKIICFIISFCFTLLHNEHWTIFFGQFHPFLEFFLYILFVSFVMKQMAW